MNETVEQVEEAAQVALDAVARAAVLPRAVVDRQLGDAVPALVREHRDEAMQLAVERAARGPPRPGTP